MESRLINQGFMPFTLTMLLAISSFAQPPAAPANAQDPIAAKTAQEQDKKSQLGERQRLVERKMAELESKFTSIAEQIRQKEPERADRLVAAYQRAKETLLKEKMNEVSQLLDQNKFAEAQQGLDQVILALEDLIRLLIDQKNDQLDKQQEIKMLEEWKKDIKQVQQDQKKQTRETENVANKDDALKKLDAQIKELNELIESQKKVVEETEANAGQGLKALDKIADQQFDVRKRTEKLSNSIAEKPQPTDGKSGDEAKENPGQPGSNSGKAGDSKSGKAKSDEKSPEKPQAGSDSKTKDDQKEKSANDGEPSKSGDSKSGDSKSGDSKSGDSKSGDSKSGDSKSGDSKSGDSKSGDSKPSASKQNESPRPGQQPLEKAQDSQRRAEEKLASGKAEDAQRQQQDALKKMEEAKLELEKEKRRIAALPPEALKQIAENQRRIRDKSMDIAKSMKDAPKPKTDSKSSEANQNQPPKQPGQQSMEQAGQSMQKAANELNEQEAEQAQRNQKESEKKLQQALDEIEERLNQLREETREEKLARLEGRFREMLDRQKTASLMTVEADDKRNSFGNLERRDQLVLLRLSNEESEINELGQQAYDLLLEDGTSVVFPEIVHYLKKDLERASELLGDERTDQLTQMVQREVESSLEELLDALKKSKKKGGGGGGGGGGGKQPLLEKSAELKMLRAAQMRLNRRTKQFDSIKSARELDADLGKEIKSMADRQAQLLEMAERIMSAEQSDQTP